MRDNKFEKKEILLDDIVEETDEFLDILNDDSKELDQDQLKWYLRSVKRALKEDKVKKAIIKDNQDTLEFKELITSLGYFNSVHIRSHEINSKFMSISRNLKELTKSLPNEPFALRFLNEDLNRLELYMSNLCEFNYKEIGHNPESNMKPWLSENRRVKYDKSDGRIVTTKNFCYIVDALIANGLSASKGDIELKFNDQRMGWEVSSDGESLEDKVDLLFKAGYTTGHNGYGFGLYYCKLLADFTGMYLEYKRIEDKNVFCIYSRKEK